MKIFFKALEYAAIYVLLMKLIGGGLWYFTGDATWPEPEWYHFAVLPVCIYLFNRCGEDW